MIVYGVIDHTQTHTHNTHTHTHTHTHIEVREPVRSFSITVAFIIKCYGTFVNILFPEICMAMFTVYARVLFLARYD